MNKGRVFSAITSLLAGTMMIAAVHFGGVSGCGEAAEGDGDGGGGGLGDATTVTGTVYAPNGTDPVAGATVYIPSSGSSTLVKNFAPAGRLVTAGDVTCADPPETSCAETCSAADGTFSLGASDCSSTSSTLKIVKGTLAATVSLDCSGTTCALAASATTFPSSGEGIPQMAVVTGTWDDIEDVLAKLGFGTVGSDGRLDTSQTFQFDLYDGNSSLDDTTYQNSDKLLDGTVPMSNYDIIFINCGTSYESQLSDSAVRQRIADFVNGGGKLYGTDLSYDYIEQVFPNFLKFEDDPDAATTPGGWGDAEDGSGGDQYNAVVNDTTLKSWLQTVTVIQHDASTPGNPDDDCTGDYTTRTGALSADETIPLGDFAGGWAQISSAHTGTGALSPTLWISSGAGVTVNGVANRPFTASVSYGSNGGKLAYTSYHTAHSCPTQYFWPQERVLMYLVLETF